VIYSLQTVRQSECLELGPISILLRRLSIIKTNPDRNCQSPSELRQNPASSRGTGSSFSEKVVILTQIVRWTTVTASDREDPVTGGTREIMERKARGKEYVVIGFFTLFIGKRRIVAGRFPGQRLQTF
jgi:hypothetical protein